MKKQIQKNFQNTLYAPLLSTSLASTYQRGITDGLWQILHRATRIAKIHKKKLIASGINAILEIKGKPRGDHPITYVIYHVPFEESENKSIGSFDVPTIDHSKIQHLDLVKWTIEAIRDKSPDAEIVLCTDKNFGKKINDENVTLIYPDVERNRPMYYRAKTYNTIVQKKWIKNVVVFLDSDAIVLKDLESLPKKLNFDVGVTSRFAPNLMPINEGVIIANAESQECINFFAHYMGTYEAIKDDKKIQAVTKNDLMRWRGGQLSLNSICGGIKLVDFRDSLDRIKILPCSIFNYAVRDKSEVQDLKEQGKVYVAHIKGKAKY